MAIITDAHSDTIPISPVARKIRGSAIPVATANLRLSFIALVKGELKPSQADLPPYACNTITYFAIISAEIIPA